MSRSSAAASPSPSLFRRLGRGLSLALAYGGATALFGLLALGPSVAAVGLAGARNPFGWLLAAAWAAVVVVVVWGFGWAAEAPLAAQAFGRRRVPPGAAPRRAVRPGARDLRRARRFVRHHRRLLARRLNLTALCGATAVAALMVAVMMRAWDA